MDYIVRYNDSADSLQHYGIKGQQYGVRRFQNEDGSLTAAGKIRYGHPGSDIHRGASFQGISAASKKAKEAEERYARNKGKRAAASAVLDKKDDLTGNHTGKIKRHMKDKLNEAIDLANVGKSWANLSKEKMKRKLKDVHIPKLVSHERKIEVTPIVTG